MLERFIRLAPADDRATEQSERDTWRFVFSDESVGRDNHRVFNRGIQTANYLRNPIVLFQHLDTEPPIGRGSNIDTSGAKCRIDVQFIPRELNPFAGMLRDLVEGGWLRALSMSWQPLEWNYPRDRGGGGVDFTKVDLLEVSVCGLPALPQALVEARGYRVDTRPAYEWAERALSAGTLPIPRQELEAISRAARTAPRARSQRLARAREIRDRIRREDLEAPARDARLRRAREVQSQTSIRSGWQEDTR